MNIFRQHYKLHFSPVSRFPQKNKIYLLFLLPCLELIFPASIAYIVAALADGKAIISLDAFGNNKMAVPLLFLTVMGLRTASISKLIQIKYNYCMNSAFELSWRIMNSARMLNRKSIYEQDTNILSNLATVEVHQIAWRYFVSIIDLYIELGVIIILAAYFFISGHYAISMATILASVLLLVRIVLPSTRSSVLNVANAGDPEDLIRFKVHQIFSILRDGKDTLLAMANGNWLKIKLDNNYKSLVGLLVKNISLSANVRYYFEFSIFSIIILGSLFIEGGGSSELLGIIILCLRSGYSLVKIYSTNISLSLSKVIVQRFLDALKNLDEMNAQQKTNHHSDDLAVNQNTPINILLEDLEIGFSEDEKVKIGNYKFTAGETVSLMGPSGSGKTTLIRTIVGALKPISGFVQLENNINSDEFYLAPQNAVILPSDLKSNILLGHEIENQIDSYLIDLGIDKKRLSELHKVKDISKEISGGEAKKIEVVRCLIHSKSKSIIVLDEIDSALDAESKKLLSFFINKEFSKKIIIFITHDQSFVELMKPSQEIIVGSIK